MIRGQRVTVFGGSGFLGRYVVQHLARAGARVNVVVRNPERAMCLKPLGDPGQIVLGHGRVQDAAQVAAGCAGAEAVVNLVGILYERASIWGGGQRFAEVHAEGARNVAEAAAAAGAKRLLHLSAIGAAATSPSLYARTKAAGEAAVAEAFPGATVLRPSVVFGPEDDFFNRFAALARFLPVLPLFGGGRTRFQPVYVGDVADAALAVIGDPESAGKTYELGGPAVYTFREILEIVLRETGRRRLLLPLPFGLAALQAAFLELLPEPPLTRDQVKLLRRDNVVAEGARGLADLGITPTAVETVVPTYLRLYRKPGPAAA